ncbi:accessory Sec system glycosyltransferase GtfA [Streptococcus sp. zg-JUN1979]|uniref:accessory Sec system glycosyltransferase GtfA n=1 Tax=Streptococcus sp. zg-JUN1979 TaxID=3391450 RepID=UPI0039A76E69
MTVYNINLGIGWASSGVEYAQAYRANVLRELGIEAKFIFTDMIVTENIEHFTANLGFRDDEIIWLYSFFTDVNIAKTSYRLADFEATFEMPPSQVERHGKAVVYRFAEKDVMMTAYTNGDDSDIVQRVEYVSKGLLIRKDYFTYTRLFSEYYAPKDNRAEVYQRTFFNEDGSIAYVENRDGKDSVFIFEDRILPSKEALVAYMLECLELTSQDVILLDRATGIGQSVFQHHGKAKLAVVIHAEHFNSNSVTDDTILWNNYYEYQFTNSDKVDAFIASTEVQKDLLSQQFAHYTKRQPTIYAIPVGSLQTLRGQDKASSRQPFSLVTASRLAAEKHIDWLVNAVILAHQDLPQLTFDIYGSGGQEKLLREIIDKNGAADYIRLRGHHDLTHVYEQYEVYIAASTSEGFGLTLMEAVGSGLPIIGLDVRYGNQTFVDDGKNGYLISRTEPDDASHMADAFAKKIIKLYQEADLKAFHNHSYNKAKAFLDDEIKRKWQAFIEEVLHD